MGLSVREELNESKLKALVDLKKIPLEDFASLLDQDDPTYVVKAS